jgi:hypothetical protein
MYFSVLHVLEARCSVADQFYESRQLACHLNQFMVLDDAAPEWLCGQLQGAVGE